MNHVRTQIRQAIVSRLQNLPSTADRVFDTQVYPLERTQLPALTVAIERDNLLSEWSTVLANGVLIQTYELPIIIRGYAKANQSVQTILDTLSVEVIEALKTDHTLGGLCKDIRFDGVSEITVAGTGEQPIGMITLNCLALYRIAENEPTIPLL